MPTQNESPLQFVPVQVSVNGKAFTYKSALTEPLQPFDKVVVEFGKSGLVVGTVESVNQVPLDPNAKFKYKFVVQWIDIGSYNRLVATAETTTGVVSIK